jgi:hypothetical protein
MVSWSESTKENTPPGREQRAIGRRVVNDRIRVFDSWFQGELVSTRPVYDALRAAGWEEELSLMVADKMARVGILNEFVLVNYDFWERGGEHYLSRWGIDEDHQEQLDNWQIDYKHLLL